MASKHILSLDFPESTNEGVLRIEDNSIYTSALPVNCLTLEITPPGFSTPTVLSGLQPGFKLHLNACQVGVAFTGCSDSCPIIGDGIYHFRLSVSPNTSVYVEYNLLRVTSTLNKWYKALCWVNSNPINPTNDSLVLIRELQLVHNNIITASHLCDDLHDYESAMEILTFSRKKLTNLSRGCHTCH